MNLMLFLEGQYHVRVISMNNHITKRQRRNEKVHCADPGSLIEVIRIRDKNTGYRVLASQCLFRAALLIRSRLFSTFSNDFLVGA